MEQRVETLDYYVLEALDLLEKKGDYTLELPESSNTLVVGSQTGLLAGRIIYRFSGRVFSHAQEVLAQHEIDTKFPQEGSDREKKILGDVTIVSATGSRQVVPIAEYALDRGLQVNAVVCKKESELNETITSSEKYPKKLRVPPQSVE